MAFIYLSNKQALNHMLDHPMIGKALDTVKHVKYCM